MLKSRGFDHETSVICHNSFICDFFPLIDSSFNGCFILIVNRIYFADEYLIDLSQVDSFKGLFLPSISLSLLITLIASSVLHKINMKMQLPILTLSTEYIMNSVEMFTYTRVPT